MLMLLCLHAYKSYQFNPVFNPEYLQTYSPKCLAFPLIIVILNVEAKWRVAVHENLGQLQNLTWAYTVSVSIINSLIFVTGELV